MVLALARTMVRQGVNVAVFGQDDPWVKTDCVNTGFPLTTGKVVGPRSFGFSPELKKKLRTRLPVRAVIHSHGLWMYSGIAARKCALRGRSPLVVSPHGMLEPWALQHSRWKKRLAGWLFENRNLRQADCLHALCMAEAEHFRSHGLKNPIAIIPNGIDLDNQSQPPAEDALCKEFPEIQARRRVLFLSRLHPKKGLSALVQAWRQLAPDFKDWCLLIAGSGQPAYEQELKKRVKDEGLANDIFFLGPVYGESKRQALVAADVFVLPSFSEGFSMAILEAAAAGLPVLLTRECNFPELAGAGAAIEISPEAGAIESGLRQVFQLSDVQRDDMGRRGLQLVKQSYTWNHIAGQMCQVYAWLAGNAAMPGTVLLD